MAYQKDGKQLQKFGIDYDEMYRKMHEAYAEAAEKNHTLLADVGSAFYEKTETENLFNDDGAIRTKRARTLPPKRLPKSF